MLDVPTMLGSVSFQSNDVRGAQNSELRFCTAHNRYTHYQYRYIINTDAYVINTDAYVINTDAYIINTDTHIVILYLMYIRGY